MMNETIETLKEKIKDYQHEFDKMVEETNTDHDLMKEMITENKLLRNTLLECKELIKLLQEQNQSLRRELN